MKELESVIEKIGNAAQVLLPGKMFLRGTVRCEEMMNWHCEED